MKKIFALLLSAVVLLPACKEEIPDPAPPPTPIVIAFLSGNQTLTKGGAAKEVIIRRYGDPFEGSVTVEVVTEGLANPALPSDYVIDPMTVVFNGKINEKVITIRAMEGDGTPGIKEFYLRLKEIPDITSDKMIKVTIRD